MHDIVKTVLFLSLSGSVLTLILLAGKPLFHNRVSKAFSYYIWLLVLLRLSLPLPSPVRFQDAPLGSEAPVISALPDEKAGFSGTGTNQVIKPPAGANHTQASPSAPIEQNTPIIRTEKSSPEQHSSDLWGFLQKNLIWIWAGGAVANLGWFSASYALFSRRIRRSCEKLPEEDEAVFACLRNGGRVRLYWSGFVSTPMFLGVFRPVVILPEAAYVRNGRERELRMILRHELVHYRRKDALYKWFVVLATSLHWFNPLISRIRREISLACELACDEAVIRNMAAEEKRFYGNMLLSLSSGGKQPAGVLATTFCEKKRDLKERLTAILNDGKKTARTAALTLVLAFLLTGCAALLGTSSGTGGEAPEPEPAGYEKGPDFAQAEGQSLQALTPGDLYIDGKLLEDVPETFINSFPDKVAAAAVPDGRKGERAGSLLERDQTILFLNSLPQHNIYLYGYHDAEYPNCGLILDIGETQQIYAFPYFYASDESLAPEISVSEDESRIYVCCHTGSGTGASVSQLYVFQIENDSILPYRLDQGDLIARLNSKISITYDEKSALATLRLDGRELLADTLFPIGAEAGTRVIPDSFYLGNQVYFLLTGDGAKISFLPTLYSRDEPGAQIYLQNLDSLDTELRFTYGGDGTITGFEIGEVSANFRLMEGGDFDGDGAADFVNASFGETDAVLTFFFANGTVWTKSVGVSDGLRMSPGTLNAGDFDGDGKDEIVFSPVVFGSNYGARELFILRAEKGGLTALPLRCEKNPAIQLEQPESLNQDGLCIGVEIVHTDGGELLRVRRLINAREDRAWYADVRLSGDIWKIENVRAGSAYGETPIYQYAGSVFVAGKRQPCEIVVRKDQNISERYVAEISFSGAASEIPPRNIQYGMPDTFLPETLQDGSRILDVNRDGNDDILLDLGVYGWPQYYACFVYDSTRNEFLPVPGFEEHPFPEVIEEEGIVLFYWKSSAAEYGADKYRIEGNALQMLGRLTKLYGEQGVRYTEEVMRDGVLVPVKTDVTEKEIERFETWRMWE